MYFFIFKPFYIGNLLLNKRWYKYLIKIQSNWLLGKTLIIYNFFKCYSCDNDQHTFNNCSLLNFKPNKSIVIAKFLH